MLKTGDMGSEYFVDPLLTQVRQRDRHFPLLVAHLYYEIGLLDVVQLLLHEPTLALVLGVGEGIGDGDVGEGFLFAGGLGSGGPFLFGGGLRMAFIETAFGSPGFFKVHQ